MTAFMLFDELERDFEPLEEHPARHAAAVAVYCLTGQKCAQRMTDGAIPPTVIGKTFAAWPKPMLSTAIADLIAIGQWEEGETGELRFVDWDLRQFTREQEEARRAKHAKRNRDYRARKKTAESVSVMHHGTHHEAAHVTAPSSSSSSSDPQPPQENTETPRSRSVVRVGGDDPVFAHWVQVMAKDPSRTKPTKDRLSKLTARRRDGYTDEQLCRAIDGCKLSRFHMGENDRGEAYNDLATILRDGKTVEAHLQRAEQGGPKPARLVRMPRTRGTTEADFEGEEEFEAQLARLGAAAPCGGSQ